MELRYIAVLLLEIVVYHLTANIKPYLVSVLYSIADRSLHICNEYIIARYALFDYTKLQILLFPIIEVNRRIVWHTHLSLGFNGYASSGRNLCGKSILSKSTIQAKHPMRNYTFHIYHVVCQR